MRGETNKLPTSSLTTEGGSGNCLGNSLPTLVIGELDGTPQMGENAGFKNGHARVETRVLKILACRNGCWTSFKQW